MNLKVPPMVFLLLVGILMKVVANLLPFQNFSLMMSSMIGTILAFFGIVISLLGVYEFRKAKTTVDPRNPHKSEFLVRAGIYKFSRNPMYLGFLIILFGWWVILENYLAFYFIPLFVLYMNLFQIKPEEMCLSQKFGEAYTEYCNEVRRWF